MVKLTRYERLQKEQSSLSFKPLMDELTQCSEEEFVEKLKGIREWDRSRDDLFTWIPVLNRIDEILTRVVEKYSYQSIDPRKQPVKLIEMSTNEEKLCVDLSQFTSRLLCNTENRFIYSSLDVMNNLLNCPNFKVKLEATKVLAIMGERYVITRERFDQDNILGNPQLKKKVLRLALSIPSSTMDEERDEHFSLVELFLDKKKYPSKWSKLKYTYYTAGGSGGNNPNNKKIPPSSSGKEAGQNSSMKRLVFSKEDLQSHSLQQLFDKGTEILPSDVWFDFSIQVTMAKAFSDDSFENIELRKLLIRTKFNAIAVVNTVYVPPQVSSKLFEVDPYAFNSLTEFVSLSETKIPRDLRLDSLFALECTSLKHVWCSDIVRNLGGNMSHGLLFQILRYIGKILRDESQEVDEEYNVRFFYLISNLADVKALHESLLGAGLIPSLLDIMLVKNTTYRRTLASATHLLEAVINDGDSTAEFISNDGFTILINSIMEEVDFALEHPEYGGPPKYSVVYYSVSFRQLAYIRSLLKLVLKLLRTDSGDRIRNLIDSPILISIKKILENRRVFGYTLITYALDIVQRVINSEPTIYPILVEAGLVPYIIDHFPEMMGPSSELLSILPDVISALCLNPEGLKKAKENNMVRFLFDAVTNPEYAKILIWKESATDLGASMDELARHYPDLKPQILECFHDIVKELPKRVSFKQPYLYEPSQSEELFFYSKDEPADEKEESAGELAFWEVQEATPLVDCFADVIYGMSLDNSTLENLPEKLNVRDLFSIIIMDRPPFDYTTSQAMLNFTDVLQLFDEQKKDYVFPEMMKVLRERLLNISEFLFFNNDESYFLRARKNRDNSDIDDLLGNFSGLAALLYLMTDVYVNVTSLIPARIHQILNFFNKDGFELIKLLRLLYQKCALEEMYLARKMPDEVITETMPEPLGTSSPVQIHATKPFKRTLKDDFTSAKYKNTFEVRFLLNKLQSCTAMLFRCFLRLTHARNMEVELEEQVIEIRVFDEVSLQMKEMLHAVELERNLPYFLVTFNFINYIYSFPKTSITGTGILQSVPAYLFYQYGGYRFYSDAIRSLFAKMSTFKNIAATEEIDYIKNTDEVLTLSCLLNLLNFFNKSLSPDTMEHIPSMEIFGLSLKGDNDYVLTRALMNMVKKMSICLIYKLASERCLFNPQARTVPYAVFKQVLTILKNIYTNIAPDDDSIVELNWDLMPPRYRNINALRSCGLTEEQAHRFISAEEHANESGILDDNGLFPSKPDVFSEEAWENYKSIKLSGSLSLTPMEPRHDNDMFSSDRLETMTDEFLDNGLPQKVFDVLPFYPKLVNAIARTLLQMFSNYDEPVENFASQVLKKILQTGLEDGATLSSLIHIFGIFLNEKQVYENTGRLISEFLEYLQKSLSPEYVNSSWFSKALYVYEIILAKSEVPIMENLPEDINVRYRLPPTPNVYRIPVNTKQNIFNSLIRVGEITNFYSALATCRILIFYARNEGYAGEIARSGTLSKLLKVIGIFQKSDKINFLESSFLLLVRRCFETVDIVSVLIRCELNKSFTTRVIGDHKEKERDLASLIEEKPHVVMRNPDKFIDNLCETARFQSFNGDGKLQEYNVYRNFQDKPVENDDLVAKNKANSTVQNRTGIIHLLLSQLMAAYKKDWTSEPTQPDDTKDNSNDKQEKVDPTRNPVCAYMMFLLKVLIELVSSYKQCKFEFLTFERRNQYTEFPKPKSTALNFFLYQLLDKSTAHEQDKFEAKRREVISMLARSVVIGFIATVQDDNTKKSDLKTIDPDMNFIRKFTIESIMRALKNSTVTSKLLEANVNKLETWFKIISSMVLVQAPYLRLLLDSNKLDADQYQICKLMIDMNVPASVTDCIAGVDLNYPFAKSLFNNAVDPLNCINSIRNTFADLFKIESNDDEEDVDEESDKEDPPDMFKNSALGMYDVEDIEEDDDEDVSLMGDDEDIAFVDGDDGDFEVVFSDDHDHGSDHGDPSGLEGSGDEEMDYGSDDREIEHMHDDEGHDGEGGDEEGSGESYYSDDSNGDIEVIDVDGDDGLEIELGDYDVDESDWESGLSELSASEEDLEDGEDGENDYDSHVSGLRRRWAATDGFDIIEDTSDEDEAAGVFQGLEHVFHGEGQPLIRIQDARRHGRHHNHSFRRNHGHSLLGPPSLTLLNGGRRNQSNLINPLGPSGLEEVENGISDQLVNVGSGTRHRPEHTHFSNVLFSGEFFDERSSDGIILKPTVSRWKDIFDMFYDTKSYASLIIPTVITKLYEPSLRLYREAEERKQGEYNQRLEKLREEEAERAEQTARSASNPPSDSTRGDHTESNEPHEPVYVNIDGAEVDIGGTDIDPEFLNALPEDMRTEVFAQHVRERRAEAMRNDVHSREIDADFLDAIPENLREEILEQESAETRFSNIIHSIGEQTHEHDEDEDMLSDEGEINIGTQSGEDRRRSENDRKKPSRTYFSPLVDRAGIAALMKSIFISQPYVQREIYHELFYRLCSSKQSRNEIINMLLVILTEGIVDENSLEKVYSLISSRANGSGKIQSSVSGGRQLPTDCSPLIVANQAIEILQNLLDSDNRLKYFFITEHENLMVNKAPVKNKKDIFHKNLKWPIKYLFGLLDRKIITDESVLMDLLTRILQVCTKPINALSKNSDESSGSKKKFQVPYFDRKDFERIVSIINMDSCNTRVFQQMLSVMHHLSMLRDAVRIFTEELISLALKTVQNLVADLDKLTEESSMVSNGTEFNSELVQKLTIPSSDQAKLLKVLTAVDYLYTHKKNLSEEDVSKLMGVYSEMELGQIWSSLSKCLFVFENRKGLNTSATVLLPLIESLMVVFKHLKTSHSGSKNTTLKYEDEKKLDFSNSGTEGFFFKFTEAHKKLLNQMIRSNPKLMSGPFSLLVKNPKVLDFDNKRYYFTVKLRSDAPDRPKLSISVRRDQVFLDSYRALFFKSNEDIKKSKLEITFKGESGVDAGGLTREWYQVLSRQMFNPDYALFLPVESDRTTFRPNRTSGINPEHLSFFKFVGMVIGKAICDQCFLDCHFSREVYKNILGRPVSLKDMESLDLDYYKSLIWILENDITDIIEETFSLETDDYGERKVVELIPGGSQIQVTEENKQEYVKKIVEYKLHLSVKEQMDNFLQGFYALIPRELISIFDEQELELLISGLPDLDVDDWRNNTNYVNYTANCKQINYFWRAVRSFDAEERAKLLQFVTGTSKVPLNGFKELTGVSGICKFSIHRDYCPTDRLPSSHTCFNQLNLPSYTSYDTLRGSLLLAINEGHEGFGIA